MSAVEHKEATERFSDAMRRAQDLAKRLASAQMNKDWLKVAKFLEINLQNGKKLAESKAIARHDALRILDKRAANLDTSKLNG